MCYKSVTCAVIMMNFDKLEVRTIIAVYEIRQSRCEIQNFISAFRKSKIFGFNYQEMPLAPLKIVFRY